MAVNISPEFPTYQHGSRKVRVCVILKAKSSGRAPTGAFLFSKAKKGSKNAFFYFCRAVASG
jgi:hypothetical protein